MDLGRKINVGIGIWTRQIALDVPSPTSNFHWNRIKEKVNSTWKKFIINGQVWYFHLLLGGYSWSPRPPSVLSNTVAFHHIVPRFWNLVELKIFSSSEFPRFDLTRLYHGVWSAAFVLLFSTSIRLRLINQNFAEINRSLDKLQRFWAHDSGVVR